MGFWGNFQGLTEATGAGEGGGSKTMKIEATSFMDGPLANRHPDRQTDGQTDTCMYSIDADIMFFFSFKSVPVHSFTRNWS